MEKIKVEYPKWLYSRTKGGRIINDALEEAQLDTADEWRDTQYPEPPKVAQSAPKPDGALPPGPCRHCKEQEKMFDSSWAMKTKEFDELKARYDTLVSEFKAMSFVTPKAKKPVEVKTAEAPAEMVEAAKEGQ